MKTKRDRKINEIPKMENSPTSKIQVGGLHEFRDFLNQVFPNLYPYLVRRLNMAEITGALRESKTPVNEILKSVYKGIYQRFNRRPENLKDLKIWIYQIAEMLLEEVLQEKVYQQNHAMVLSELENLELWELEEKYTIDAEGELVLFEELDDPSYRNQYRYHSTVLTDATADEHIEQVLSCIDREVLHREIERILVQLPEQERSIFDLFWLGGMDLEQLSQIRKTDENEIVEVLQKVTWLVKEKLEQRLKS